MVWDALEEEHGPRPEHDAWLDAARRLERQIDPRVVNALGE